MTYNIHNCKSQLNDFTANAMQTLAYNSNTIYPLKISPFVDPVLVMMLLYLKLNAFNSAILLHEGNDQTMSTPKDKVFRKPDLGWCLQVNS